MDWDQTIVQAGLIFLKEGLNFVFSNFKDKSEADDAKERDEAEAQIIGEQALEERVDKYNEHQILNERWVKVATLFWLGNDLMWIQDMMYRGALPERVLQGVIAATKYFTDLGFDDTSFPIQQLYLCHSILESHKGESEFSPTLLQQKYENVNQYVTSVKWYVSGLLEQQQPDFEKFRAF